MAMMIAPKRTIQKAKAKLGKVVLEHAVKATMVHVPRVTKAKVAPNDLVADREMMVMATAKAAHAHVLAHETRTMVKVAHVLAHEMMATAMVTADLDVPTVMTTHAHRAEGGPATATETTTIATPAAITVDATVTVTETIIAAMIVAVMMASEKAVGVPTITEAVPIIEEAADAQAVVTVVAATTIAAAVAETIIAGDETAAGTMAVAIMAIAAITQIATIPVAEIGIPRTTTIQLILMKRI